MDVTVDAYVVEAGVVGAVHTVPNDVQVQTVTKVDPVINVIESTVQEIALPTMFVQGVPGPKGDPGFYIGSEPPENPQENMVWLKI